MAIEQSTPDGKHDRRYMLTLTLGALGVVYGDIGTSPLYAFRECFTGHMQLEPNLENVLGILSLIVWSLILIVSIKYVWLVMRADNRGEGGVLALLALVLPQLTSNLRLSRRVLEYLGLFGAALIYGDGMITPAISVLSAVEGLKVVTPSFEPYIISITVAILIGLFLIQKHGTGRMGKYFGPIIVIWFAVLGLLGFISLIQSPEIIAAFSPHYGVKFLLTHGHDGVLILGSVFLVATGAEALYADMGHFGRRPIRMGWFGVALPALLLNYFGQGALLLRNPEREIVESPFYHLAPAWAQVPLVMLATSATVIASQALISGAFSLTRQAVQLGYLPRLQIRHTSDREIGQIYVPVVNTFLLISTLILVIAFKSSSNLANAYGIAVVTTMVITTTLMFVVAQERWKWNAGLAYSVFGCLLFVDLVFFGSNLLKIHQGGWVTLLIGAGIFLLMSTWRRGRDILAQALRTLTPPFDRFLGEIKTDNSIRVPGVAIFMTRNIERTPPALIHNVKHNKVVHKTVILLQVITEELSYLSDNERVRVRDLGGGFYSVTMHFGFMESPDVPSNLELIKKYISDFSVQNVTFFLGRETLLATQKPGMAIWRERLFAFMMQNAQRATIFYSIPPEQVIEIGFQVEI